MASSLLPSLKESPLGWGPTDEDLPFFADVPYAPFNKSDKLGKASDFTSTTNRQYQTRHSQASVATPFNVVDEVDEDEFHLVDSRPTHTQKTKQYGNRFRANRGRFNKPTQQQQQRRPGQRNANAQPKHRYNKRGGGAYQARRHYYGDKRNPRESSVSISPEWGEPIETFEFNKLSKLKDIKFGEAEDLLDCGTLEYYNNSYSVLSHKQEKSLERNWAQDRTFFKVTTSEDPNIRKFAEKGEADVFVTDSILTFIMASARSSYSWDIVITKRRDQIFFDKRNNKLDLLSVNENSSDPPDATDTDSINTPAKLSQEATFINQNFSQQVLIKDKSNVFSFPYNNPFASENSNVASVAYRYRRYDLGDYSLICRSEIDGVKQGRDGKNSLISIKALNEYDPKVTGDWHKRLETQRGAVLATEIKNNAVKLARWASAAVLAGASSIELGFVTRQQPRDNYNHTILAIQSYKPSEFIFQMNLNFDNMWSIVHNIVDYVNKQEDGKYLLFKDPDAANLKLYKLPENAFTSDEQTQTGAGALHVLK